ncbi:response regulator transcription factor [Saprospiraceae bacterium]|nr:response regulator transcription factor [Saprospiraceae bacterium]
MRILLVEDEKNLRDIITLNLELEKYEVVSAVNGEDALSKIEGQYFDIIILDLMLPKINGLDVLATLRIKNPNIPVIIISAKGTSSDRITGLKSGANDYLSKPFEMEELILRIQNLVQRAPTVSNDYNEDIFVFGNNKIDFKAYKGWHGDQSFDMSPKETQIIKLLVNNKNEVVSRQDILKTVWGYDVFPSTRTIDNFIATLRKNFEDDPKFPKYIRSVRGIGYKLEMN